MSAQGHQQVKVEDFMFALQACHVIQCYKMRPTTHLCTCGPRLGLHSRNLVSFLCAVSTEDVPLVMGAEAFALEGEHNCPGPVYNVHAASTGVNSIHPAKQGSPQCSADSALQTMQQISAVQCSARLQCSAVQCPFAATKQIVT